MKKINFNIEYEVYEQLQELKQQEQELCLSAEHALTTSYSPYSNFRVGCAIRLTNGQLVLGSNQENIAYPSGLCAERVALFSIGSSYPDAVIESMAITASTSLFDINVPVTCCGSCLQVMSEFERKQQQAIQVYFYCLGGEILKVSGVDKLLPFGFVEQRLKW